MTLFLAQIERLILLQGSIHAASTLAFEFFPDYKHFHVRKASVKEAHVPSCYVLLGLCSVNTALHFSEPNLRRSKCYKALLVLPAPLLYDFFEILMIFTCYIKLGVLFIYLLKQNSSFAINKYFKSKKF